MNVKTGLGRTGLNCARQRRTGTSTDMITGLNWQDNMRTGTSTSALCKEGIDWTGKRVKAR